MIKTEQSPYVLPLDLLENSGYGFDKSRLEKAMEQAETLGFDEIEFPFLDFQSSLFKFVNKTAMEAGLCPYHRIGSGEFAISAELDQLLGSGVGIKVLIYEAVSPAFLERVEKLKHYKSLIKFVLIVRKDWNYMSVFKSLPYEIRDNLFVDFPVKLQPSDHFYNYDEILGVINKMNKNMPGVQLRTLNPHCHLYESLLRGSLVIEDERLDYAKTSHPKLSIVGVNSEYLQEVSKSPMIQNSCEIISFSEGPSDQYVQGIVNHKMRLDEESRGPEERRAVSLNWITPKANGQYVYFPSTFNQQEIDEILSFVDSGNSDCGQLLEKGILVVEKGRFTALRGFDPLFSLYGFRNFEFVYKYSSAFCAQARTKIMVHWKSQMLKTEAKPSVWGAQLFLHKYFDAVPVKEFLPWKSKKNSPQSESRKPIISPRQIYIFIRFRDAYLSLFDWTPLVFIEGNLVILFSFGKRTLIRSVQFIKKVYFHKSVFRLFAPIRKVYYFSRFQYRKRVLKENPND